MNLIDVPIEQRTLIRAPIEKVYRLLTTAEGLDAWFTNGSKVDLKVGGEIHLRWTEERTSTTKGIEEDGGPILEVDSPNRFVFQWHPDNKDYATKVEINLYDKNGSTLVYLMESGFLDTLTGRKAYMGCATGWGEALTMLKYYAEHNILY
ncbi:hypothetical protein ES708_23601 [subsurface metagenome]